jgi:glycosyltransferase involved in cell wall biosynthesis
MKSILLFIDSLTQGGAQRQIVGLACLLQERGYGVHVLTYHDIPFYAPYLEKHGVSHQVIKGAENPINRIRKVRQLFKHLNPDTVISYLDTPNILACIVKMSGLRFQLIVSERNTTQRLSFKERIKFWLYRYTDTIVSNSKSQADYICCHYPKLAQKVEMITNFVDLGAFKPSKNVINRNTFNIIGVGRMEPQKNIPQFIKAIQETKRRGLVVAVDWYGRRTSYSEQYQAQIRQCGLQDIFRLHDATNDIAEKYQESDLFCLPSMYEGYPNVLCEAMACGLPVICSDVCDNANIIECGINGFLFDSQDVDSIVRTLSRFLELSIKERQNMGKESRRIAEQKFGMDQFVDKYIKIIGE